MFAKLIQAHIMNKDHITRYKKIKGLISHTARVEIRLQNGIQ